MQQAGCDDNRIDGTVSGDAARSDADTFFIGKVETQAFDTRVSDGRQLTVECNHPTHRRRSRKPADELGADAATGAGNDNVGI